MIMARRLLWEWFPAFMMFVGVLFAWQIAVSVLGIREYLLPSPAAVGHALISSQINWVGHIVVTGTAILGAFLIAGAVGILLGTMIAWSSLISRALMPFLVFVNTLPKVAVAPLFLLWLGYGILPNMLIGALIGAVSLSGSLIAWAKLDGRIEGTWRVSGQQVINGSVFVVAKAAEVAQLRLLYVEPAMRGHGLGRRLTERAIAFAREAGYRRMVLWTQSILTSAHKIYAGKGFVLREEEPHHSFGVDLVGQGEQPGRAGTGIGDRRAGRIGAVVGGGGGGRPR